MNTRRTTTKTTATAWPVRLSRKRIIPGRPRSRSSRRHRLPDPQRLRHTHRLRQEPEGQLATTEQIGVKRPARGAVGAVDVELLPDLPDGEASDHVSDRGAGVGDVAVDLVCDVAARQGGVLPQVADRLAAR